jgi:hypothetical protein
MPRKMLAAIAFAGFLLWWPCVAENQSAQQPAEVPPASAFVNPPVNAPCSDKAPCYIKDAAAEKLSPKWQRPEWVIVDVTIVYVLIAGFTLLAIKRQAAMMDRQNAIILNEKRPRLLLQPQPFTVITNGFPDIRISVTNIGGSKAIFGLCLAGMEATGLEEITVSKRPNNTGMLKRLTNKILESGEIHEERIELSPMAEVFPPGLDKSKPYKIHIFGSLNFKDILFEDSWVRDFHYVLVSMEDVYMVQFGKRSSEFWMSMKEEEDRKRRKRTGFQTGIVQIRKAWTSYKAWIEKEETDS